MKCAWTWGLTCVVYDIIVMVIIQVTHRALSARQNISAILILQFSYLNRVLIPVFDVARAIPSNFLCPARFVFSTMPRSDCSQSVSCGVTDEHSTSRYICINLSTASLFKESVVSTGSIGLPCSFQCIASTHNNLIISPTPEQTAVV